METMLRRLSLLLALLIALAGCAAAEEVPNPRVEMADASELEAALGFPVNAPEGVDAVYTVIGGSTGEAAFDVGDIACTLRAARTQDDISGLFMEMSDPVEEERAAGEDAVSVSLLPQPGSSMPMQSAAAVISPISLFLFIFPSHSAA